MADFPRIEELRRRVQQDPASIAFAALADEYRRAGRFDEAVETCRAGLLRHPAYVSARVTLGRALLELGEFDEAEAELQQVLRAAPENLAAIRALAEIHHRRGDAPDRTAEPPKPEPKGPALSQPKGESKGPLTVAPPAADTAATASTVVPFSAPAPAPPPPVVKKEEHPALPKLERFLAAIQRARRELDSDISIGR